MFRQNSAVHYALIAFAMLAITSLRKYSNEQDGQVGLPLVTTASVQAPIFATLGMSNNLSSTCSPWLLTGSMCDAQHRLMVLKLPWRGVCRQIGQ
jgi:hypothetical protein